MTRQDRIISTLAVLIATCSLAVAQPPAHQQIGAIPNREASNPTPPTQEQLAEERQDIRRAARQRFGQDYRLLEDPDRALVWVSALDEATLRRTSKRLAEYHDALREELFGSTVLWNTAIVLPTQKDFHELIRQDVLGVYHMPTRTLVSISLSNILIHEFVHALHHQHRAADPVDHPLWVTEGLAMLYQTATLEDGQLRPDNAGVREIRLAMNNGTWIPLAELLQAGQDRFRRQPDLCYGQSRLLMLYLHRQWKLKEFYQTFRKTLTEDPTGKAALEAVLAAPLPEIQKRWGAWLGTLESPWRPAGQVQAHLGIRMAAHDDGVRIAAMLPGSAAKKGGQLRIGDIILSIGGMPTPNARALTQAVQSFRPGQIIIVEVLREGKTRELKQLLGRIRARGTQMSDPPTERSGDSPARSRSENAE